jgi:hypothetical protein
MKSTEAPTESFKFALPLRRVPGAGLGGHPLRRQSWEKILLVAHCRAEAGIIYASESDWLMERGSTVQSRGMLKWRHVKNSASR